MKSTSVKIIFFALAVLGAIWGVVINLPALREQKSRSPNFFFSLHRTPSLMLAPLTVFFVGLSLCYAPFLFNSNNVMALVILVIAWIYSEHSNGEVINLPVLLEQKSRSPNFFSISGHCNYCF